MDRPTATNSMQELDQDECWRLLRAGSDDNGVGRLAISISQHPDIFPINYVVDGETIVFRTGAGTKLAAAVLGRGVAFEIDGYDEACGEAWSVVLKGQAREIEHMIEYFQAENLPLFPWHASHKPDLVRIEPETITGRRFFVVGRHQADDSPSGADEHTR